jgi:DNA-binding transcriptional LysR family regulator
MVSQRGSAALAGVDLNLLVALDALLTERNVTRAAERTSVGQPAMSSSLARLRRHFQDPILVREGRRLMPTPLAESLIGPVRVAVDAAESVMGRLLAFDPATDQRSFTIVASDYVTLILLRPLIGAVASEAPGVRINVTPVNPDFADQLRRGQADMLIVPPPVAGQRFAFPHEHLFTDRYVLVADRTNDAVGDTVTADELTRLSYVAFSAGSLAALLDTQLDAMGIRLRVEISTQAFMVAPFLVAGTSLVSLVHERLANEVAAAAGLRIIEPDVSLQPIHEAIYWNPRHTEDPAHRWLRDRIRALAREL